MLSEVKSEECSHLLQPLQPRTTLPGCCGPAWCPWTQGLCPGWGTWLSPSSLHVQPVAKLSLYLRDTNTERSHRLPRPQTAFHSNSIGLKQKRDSPSPSFSPHGRDRSSLVQDHTQHSPGSQVHTHFWIPGVPGIVPLSAQHCCVDPGSDSSSWCWFHLHTCRSTSSCHLVLQHTYVWDRVQIHRGS